MIFGLFNGMCVLPVLLSWFGPPPYLNATNVSLTSRMSLKLKTLSSQNESRPHQKLRTSLTTSQEREQHRSVLRSHSLKVNGHLGLHNIELQKLSEDINESLSMLETQAENNVPKEQLVLSLPKTPQVIIEQPKTHEEIIRDCEEYLLSEQQQQQTSNERQQQQQTNNEQQQQQQS